MALGVEKAGFETIGLIEFNRDACDTLKKNRPQWNVICDDIANISVLDLEEYFHIKSGELDLLSGGAPCQAFSYAGKRLGLEDARGTLFYHYAIFLEKLQPKMFLFENVRGLLTHDKGKTYRTMLDIFENAGYDIQKDVLNAWDYAAGVLIVREAGGNVLNYEGQELPMELDGNVVAGNRLLFLGSLINRVFQKCVVAKWSQNLLLFYCHAKKE